MTTQTHRGISGGTIVVVAGILAVAGLFATGKLPTRKTWDDERLVTVSAIWTPSPLPVPSLVRIHVEVGSINDDTIRETAPWSQTYTVLKGERVFITAAMRGWSGERLIGCSIAVNGVEVAQDHKKGTGEGSVTCEIIA